MRAFSRFNEYLNFMMCAGLFLLALGIGGRLVNDFVIDVDPAMVQAGMSGLVLLAGAGMFFGSAMKWSRHKNNNVERLEDAVSAMYGGLLVVVALATIWPGSWITIGLTAVATGIMMWLIGGARLAQDYQTNMVWALPFAVLGIYCGAYMVSLIDVDGDYGAIFFAGIAFLVCFAMAYAQVEDCQPKPMAEPPPKPEREGVDMRI